MKLTIKAVPKSPKSGSKDPEGPKHGISSLIAIILKQKVPKFKGLDTKHFSKKK